MKQTTKKLLINLIQIVVLAVAVVLLWYAAALIYDNELVLPEPWGVIKLTFTLLGKGATYLALLYTLLRALVAFVVSVIFAVLLGLLVGVFPQSGFVVNAIVTVLRAFPTIAIILVVLILFNSGVTPVVVAFLVAFPIAYSTFTRQFEHNQQLLNLCKVYNVAPSKKVKYVLFPLMRDELLPLVSDQLPLCIKVVVAGEVLALPLSGIGRQMYVAKVNLDTANVVALTILTLVVCFAISGTVALCRRKKK